MSVLLLLVGMLSVAVGLLAALGIKSDIQIILAGVFVLGGLQLCGIATILHRMRR